MAKPMKQEVDITQPPKLLTTNALSIMSKWRLNLIFKSIHVMGAEISVTKILDRENDAYERPNDGMVDLGQTRWIWYTTHSASAGVILFGISTANLMSAL